MKLAIMQPYFFPYLGYWQLLDAVDRFVVFDDVNYINRGWINRNRILVNGQPTYLTVPLQQASQNRRICDITIQAGTAWREKMLRTIETTYRKSPYFHDVFTAISGIIRYESDDLADFLLNQLRTLAGLLAIKVDWIDSSRLYDNTDLSGQERILDICRREAASVYVNPEGGQALYQPGSFRERGIDLKFIVMRPLPYPQRAGAFVPYLSILDALMELGPSGIRNHLAAYDLLEGSHVASPQPE